MAGICARAPIRSSRPAAYSSGARGCRVLPRVPRRRKALAQQAAATMGQLGTGRDSNPTLTHYVHLCIPVSYIYSVLVDNSVNMLV